MLTVALLVLTTKYDIYTYTANSWQLGKDPGHASSEKKYYLIPLSCVALHNQKITFYFAYMTKGQDNTSLTRLKNKQRE